MEFNHSKLLQEQLKTAASSKDLSVEEIGKSILSYIKKNLPSMEKTDSEALQQLFNSWNNRREQQLNNQVNVG